LLTFLRRGCEGVRKGRPNKINAKEVAAEYEKLLATSKEIQAANKQLRAGKEASDARSATHNRLLTYTKELQTAYKDLRTAYEGLGVRAAASEVEKQGLRAKIEALELKLGEGKSIAYSCKKFLD